MADNKNNTKIPRWLVGLLIAAVSVGIAYGVSKANLDSLNNKTDTLKTDTNIELNRLDSVKLEKETFKVFKDQHSKDFDEFKTNQTKMTDDLNQINLANARIEMQLIEILKAVNDK